jgi:hypothetical protein
VHYRLRRRSFPVIWLATLGLFLTACLGQDYKNLNLSIDDTDHGWLVAVEAEEEFEVNLWDSPVYPDAIWRPVDFDPTVIELLDSFHISHPAGNPADLPEEERAGVPEDQVGHSVYIFSGTTGGESPLAFELVADGRQLNIAEFMVAVVEEACDGDTGLAAPRCQREDPGDGPEPVPPGPQTLHARPGDQLTVLLAANALHLAAPWEAVASDSSVVQLAGTQHIDARTPGNWDTTDSSESGSFLPTSQFTFTALAVGESRLQFEIVSAGTPVGFFEVIVVVEE